MLAASDRPGPCTRWWPRSDDERHPPVRAHAPPARRGGRAHPDTARPTGGRRRRVPDLHRDARPGHRRRDPATTSSTRRTPAPGDVLVYQMATRSDMVEWLAVPAGAGRRELPQHHAVRVLRALEQLDRPAPGRRPPSTWRPGADRRRWASGCRRSTPANSRAVADRDVVVIPVANVRDPAHRAGPGSRRRPRPAGGRTGHVGCRSDGSHPTRRTRTPSPPCSWPGRPRRPTPDSPSSAHRPSRATPGRCSATRPSSGLADSVDFVSRISDAELSAHYGSADVLVMLSEHEGFGVPLVEAMPHGLPVVAYASGAVPEVVGDAGVLLEARAPAGWPRRWPGCWAIDARREALVAARAGPSPPPGPRPLRIGPGSGVAGRGGPGIGPPGRARSGRPLCVRGQP